MFVENPSADSSHDELTTPLTGSEIFLVAHGDFFSDCLLGALLGRFPQYRIKMITEIAALHRCETENSKLILFYQVTQRQLQAGLQILQAWQPAPCVGLVADTVDSLNAPYIRQLIELKMIDGVLPLTLGLDVLMAAVELIIKGGEHFPSALLSGPASERGDLERQSSIRSQDYSRSYERGNEAVSLTAREVQVLVLIRRGMRNRAIAEMLGLSENTVKVHVRNIYKKMKVQNRIEAASFFEHRGDKSFKAF
jgi:DNA-binding NarL/FixJ family response regulator